MANYNEVMPEKLGRKNKARLKRQNESGGTPTIVQNNNNGWPESLSEFVNKLFDRLNSLSADKQTQFSGQIQKLMELAIAQKKVWTNPWQHQGLPVFDPSYPLDLHENIVKKSDIEESQHLSTTVPPSVRASGGKSDDFDSKERKRQRTNRFASTSAIRPSTPPASNPDGPIIGYLTALEKRYLRLTSEPDPAMVRPECNLKKSLEFVCKKYNETNAGYLYINDQLKAIRQDLTVQHIKNELTITVYETHGRIAILNDDLGEFNQCLSQLKHLYSESKSDTDIQETYEFTCYRIIYFIITGNYAEVNKINMEILSSDTRTEEAVPRKYREFYKCMYEAFDLLTFIVQGNYHDFFKILRHFRKIESLKCATHLIDRFLTAKQRLSAINVMCMAFKKLTKDYLTTELAFETSEGTDSIEDFMIRHKLDGFLVGSDFDCAAAKATVNAIVKQGNFKKVDIKGQK